MVQWDSYNDEMKNTIYKIGTEIKKSTTKSYRRE